MNNRDPLERGFIVKTLVRGLIALNVIIMLTMILFTLFSARSVVSAAPAAQGGAVTSGTTPGGEGVAANGLKAIAMALSTGLATIGAGLAVGMTGSAALGVIAERPEFFGRSLIFVGLGEGIAIYGLIVSFLILTQ